MTLDTLKTLCLVEFVERSGGVDSTAGTFKAKPVDQAGENSDGSDEEFSVERSSPCALAKRCLYEFRAQYKNHPTTLELMQMTEPKLMLDTRYLCTSISALCFCDCGVCSQVHNYGVSSCRAEGQSLVLAA